MLKARSVISFDPIKQIGPPLISAVIMAASIWWVNNIVKHAVVGIVTSVSIGALVYFILVRYLFRIKIIEEVRSLIKK
jgi:hypothetical protein